MTDSTAVYGKNSGLRTASSSALRYITPGPTVRSVHCWTGSSIQPRSSQLLEYKPAAAVAVCRRGGASAALDRLNKYFSINNMPVVSSRYWNIAYGSQPGEAARDAEGMQTMRTLGRNMAWVLKGLKTQSLPVKEPAVKTNFVR